MFELIEVGQADSDAEHGKGNATVVPIASAGAALLEGEITKLQK